MHVLFSRNELTVQSLSNAQHQNFLESQIKSKINIIVADKTDNVKYHTEKRICINEEYVDFTID